MSFIIKGFDTDGNCLHCFFQSEDTDRCLLTDDDVPLYGQGHPESCPLVPIPEGHGRLIDADELRKAMYHEAFETDSPMQKWESGCWIRYKMFERNLENAPTIVPVEGGNADG